MPQLSHDQMLAHARALLTQNHPPALQQSETLCRQILSTDPRSAPALHLLGTIAWRTGHAQPALELFEQSLALAPDNAQTWNDLALAASHLGRMDHALTAYRQVTALAPAHEWGHFNLAQTLLYLGLIDDALAALRRAIALRQNFPEAHSLYLANINFHPSMSARRIYEEHRTWNQHHAVPLLKTPAPFPSAASAGHPLRIGYVSPNFRRNVIGRFIKPLLENHDPKNFEIFLYHDTTESDPLTLQLQSRAAVFRTTAGMSDDQLDSLIRSDSVHILVDLTMHLTRNRIGLFARKPAPLQLTYLAYVGTTGLTTIDYRISDPHLDPPSLSPITPQTAIYSEQTLLLPNTYWCYQPPDDAPPLEDRLNSPALRLGCLNNFLKISPQALAVWAIILRQLPSATLLLNALPGSPRERTLQTFAHQGIAPTRIEFTGNVPLRQYLSLQQNLDIALDPFPYAGGTTSCDALWMGTPVISLAGDRAVGRGGVSILNNINTPELIAATLDEYISKTLALARDPTHRQDLRKTLRPRMQNSPLMDAPNFTRHMENLYHQIWTHHSTPRNP